MRLLVIPFFAIILYSCSNNTVYEQVKPVDEKAWDYRDTLAYEFAIEDTNQNYNLIISLKYKKNYSYSNIFFFVDVVDPEMDTYRDTIECFMAAPSGRWLGESSGDYIEQKLIYRQNVNFPKKGTYKINLQHAMRDTLLRNMSEVGLELQEFEEK